MHRRTILTLACLILTLELRAIENAPGVTPQARGSEEAINACTGGHNVSIGVVGPTTDGKFSLTIPYTSPHSSGRDSKAGSRPLSAGLTGIHA